jgi:DMSO/TMAO reductase YedYZ molybdopterin-dependent catalytic subunit
MTAPRAYAAAAGLVAAANGLAVSELLSGLFHQRVSPLVAVAESVIRLTPGSVIEGVISILGHHDKQVLIGLTLCGLAGVSLLVGTVSARSLAAGVGAFVLMGVVLVLAVHARLTPSTSTYIPAVAGVLVAIAVLALLAPRAGRLSESGGTPQPPGAFRSGAPSGPTRRSFLQLAGALSAGAVLAGGTGRVLAQRRAAVEAARRRLRLPIRTPTTPPGAEVGVDGVAPWITSQERFYRIDTALAVPEVLPQDWKLRIHGMVDRELTLGYQDLLDRGLVDSWLTLCCVSNQVGGDLISNARWSGVRTADVLADARPQPGADAVLSTSADGWTCGTPLAALTDGRNALFAVAMNGEPLVPEHGFPVRMVVPGLYGYVSATKWVVDVEVSRFSDFTAFWTDRGWSAQGPVKLQSRIDVPSSGSHVGSGRVTLAGVAWEQHTGVSRVEVRVDDGPWQLAELARDVSIDTWRQWRYECKFSPGDHQVQVRATDAAGQVQTGETAGVLPDGATGWHTITVHA